MLISPLRPRRRARAPVVARRPRPRLLRACVLPHAAAAALALPALRAAARAGARRARGPLSRAGSGDVAAARRAADLVDPRRQATGREPTRESPPRAGSTRTSRKARRSRRSRRRRCRGGYTVVPIPLPLPGRDADVDVGAPAGSSSAAPSRIASSPRATSIRDVRRSTRRSDATCRLQHGAHDGPGAVGGGVPAVTRGAVIVVAALALAGLASAAGPPPGGRPVVVAGCEGLYYDGPGRPDVVVVSSLPLEDSAHTAMHQMTQAIKLTLKDRGFRAGRFRVGYVVCDDSGPAGKWSVRTCARNARAAARAERRRHDRHPRLGLRARPAADPRRREARPRLAAQHGRRPDAAAPSGRRTAERTRRCAGRGGRALRPGTRREDRRRPVGRIRPRGRLPRGVRARGARARPAGRRARPRRRRLRRRPARTGRAPSSRPRGASRRRARSCSRRASALRRSSKLAGPLPTTPTSLSRACPSSGSARRAAASSRISRQHRALAAPVRRLRGAGGALAPRRDRGVRRRGADPSRSASWRRDRRRADRLARVRRNGDPVPAPVTIFRVNAGATEIVRVVDSGVP